MKRVLQSAFGRPAHIPGIGHRSSNNAWIVGEHKYNLLPKNPISGNEGFKVAPIRRIIK